MCRIFEKINLIFNSNFLRDFLSSGGFAIVYQAADLSTGEEYALKRIFSADDTSNKAIRDEIGYLVNISLNS